ncbi:SEC10/PgrA surface exclusion domain-containing protein [Streptococcus periodonticum]|uniref:SEC10/PgrA surface exclusion domain-containing protein n=1 Tax=Streptococcus periodonticum TaxID=2490633 RepID=UPI00157FBC0F|nr:SEC10/PgrA surface exclusion domain-containing protein [Streptococcus periodonticum]
MAKRKLKSLAATTAITLAAVGTPALADEVTPTVNTSNESIIKTNPSTGATTEPHKVTSDEVKNDVDAQKQNVATAQSQVNNATANATAADQAQAKAQAEADAANQAVKNAEANAAKATPKNIAANQADQAANLADQKANAKETEQVNAEITNQTNKVTNAQTAVNTAQSEKDAANANVTAKDADVKSAQAAIDGTGQAKAQENLAKAKADTKAAEANVATATQAVDTAKKADADRNAKVKAAETDVKVKSDAVTNAANRVTAAQNAVKSTTDKLTEATTAVQKAQKALDNADKVTIADGTQFKADRKTGDSDYMTDSGATMIENSSTKIGEDDKYKIVNVNALSDAEKQELALYALQVINSVRASQGLAPLKLTTGGMQAAQDQARKYIARNKLIQSAGHIHGNYFGENVSNIKHSSASMYDIKTDIYNAIMSMAFADAPSKWVHTNNMLSHASDLGVAFATFGGRTHLINVHGTYTGTEIVNPEDITKLEANLAQAKATQAKAQTASDAAKAELTKASADYAAALDLKTQAEKVLADAQATPLQTQVAENNLRLAKIALQNAQEREIAAQKALDNFTADLATKKAKLEEAKAALATAKTNAETKATALETAKAELVKQQAKLDSLNKEKVALLAEKDRLVAEAKALATELKGYLEAPAILAAAQATASEKDSALKDAMTKAKAAHTKLKELQAKLAEEQTKLAELQTKYDRLKDLEDKAKDNKIITLPDGTIVAVPKVAPTAEKLPEFDPSTLVEKPVEKPKEQKGNGNTTVNSVSGTSPAGITVTQTASGEKVTYSRVARAKALPQTGEQESLLAVFGVAILSILGLTGARRKRRG